MPQPTLNGVMKPADVIAKGPHAYNEATRKYEERPQVWNEYPRAMWHHEKRAYAEAHTRKEQDMMEAEGWSTKPYIEQVQKETVVTPPVNLAEILLAQSVQMETMRKRLEEFEKKQPTTAPAVPEEAKRAPGRPKNADVSTL